MAADPFVVLGLESVYRNQSTTCSFPKPFPIELIYARDPASPRFQARFLPEA